MRGIMGFVKFMFDEITIPFRDIQSWERYHGIKLWKCTLMTIWQLPQAIIALVLEWIYRNDTKRKRPYDDHIVKVVVIRDSKFGPNDTVDGLSMGTTIFVDELYDKNLILAHEYGHIRQSRYFGPLYLIVIGLPSILRALEWRLCKKPIAEYYDGWPEKWADKLGGIKR